jgi:histone-lysine N-methyltransferase SETMAR
MPEVENRTIASTKTMLTVLWNPHGFHVVTMLPPGESLNALRFRDQNLAPLIQSFFPSGWSPRQNKLMVHVDNAPAHNSRMTQNFFQNNPLKSLLHPPYSPNLSPSDFFEKVKGGLIGQEIPDEISLLDAVT